MRRFVLGAGGVLAFVADIPSNIVVVADTEAMVRECGNVRKGVRSKSRSRQGYVLLRCRILIGGGGG